MVKVLNCDDYKELICAISCMSHTRLKRDIITP